MPQTPEQRAEKWIPWDQATTDAVGLGCDGVYNTRDIARASYAACIREQVEPLEAENAKLRALVQVLVDAVKMESDFGNALLNKKNVHGAKAEFHTRKALAKAKEQGFVPTNTEDNG